MKVLILTVATIISLPVFSDSIKKSHNNHHAYDRHPKSLAIFDVVPTNSPVKESLAKFLLKIPKGFEVDEVQYKVRNASRRFDKDYPYQKINLISGPQGKELHISISKLSPGFYKLFVKVRDRKKNEHFYKTKFKDHAMFVVDNSVEVKLPDPKINDATLLGVDSDNDGIRDDVQRWINENFSSKPKEVKLALKQYAIDMQSSLLSSSDKTASIQATNAALKSQGCLSHIGKELDISAKERNEYRKKVELMYLNTKERIEADLKASENFHGQEVTLLSKEEECSF